MKKIKYEILTIQKALALATCLLTTTLNAQNVQVHYDLGNALYDDIENRPAVTSTVEMFKPDKWGSNFFFIDFDYFSDGAAGAYWEISREFNLGKQSPWAAHIEYNGGMTSIEDTNIASRFQHALLTGAAWNWAAPDFSKTFSLQAMYKRYFKGMNRGGFNSCQLTAVWTCHFIQRWLTFSGYVDVWYDKDAPGKNILQSEPQLWVNLNKLKGMNNVNLSVGSEVEISNNFVYNNRGERNHFFAIPTIAAKWEF